MKNAFVRAGSVSDGPHPSLTLPARQRRLYPFAGHFLEIGGFRLHYLDEGAGDPVVMLHGNPTWSFYYRNLASALRDDYRVVVPDHIGCGLSDKPDAGLYPYTLERRVQDLDELLERIGVREKVTLVLHDWGGMIGMAWAHCRPERVKRLVVLNTGAFHLPRGKRLPWSLWMCRTPVIGPLLVRGLNAFSRAAVRWCVTRRPMPKDVRPATSRPTIPGETASPCCALCRTFRCGPATPAMIW